MMGSFCSMRERERDVSDKGAAGRRVEARGPCSYTRQVEELPPLRSLSNGRLPSGYPSVVKSTSAVPLQMLDFCPIRCPALPTPTSLFFEISKV